MAKITLTGSLGNIGKPLVTALVENGHAVKVISSNANRQKEIERLGATAAIGSIDDTTFLTTAFMDADIVYLMEPPIDQKLLTDPAYTFADVLDNIYTIVGNYKEAVLRTSVKKVIHLSSLGAHTDKNNGLLKHHFYAEKILNELPADVSIKFMRPVGLYVNLLPLAQVIKQLGKGFVGAYMSLRYYGLRGLFGGRRGIILSNLSETDMNLLVSPIDVAQTIADEIEKSFHGRTFHYIASEELTCKEVASFLGEAIGKPYLKWGQISDKQLLNAMIKMNWSPSIAEAFVEMQAAGRGGTLYQDYYKHRPVLSKTKLKNYIPEFVTAYQRQ